MRTQIVLLCLVCSIAWSQPQQPPKAAPATKANSAESAQEGKESNQRQRPPDKGGPPVANNQAATVPNKNTAESKSNQELHINWWLAVFTGLLVAVGAAQTATLIWQARVLSHHSELIKDSVEQMKRAVAAYQGFVQASQNMLTLTRKSNEITAQATELTRQSFVLSHRPRLVVRNVVVRVPRGEQDIASVAQRLADGVIDSVHGGQLYVVNSGDTDATITRTHSEMFDGERLPMAAPYEGKPGTASDITLAPGVQVLIPFPSEPFVRQYSVVRVRAGWEKFWVLGWIEYVDGAGNTRRTLFCRQWSNESSRFIAVDDADYERAD